MNKLAFLTYSGMGVSDSSWGLIDASSDGGCVPAFKYDVIVITITSPNIKEINSYSVAK